MITRCRTCGHEKHILRDARCRDCVALGLDGEAPRVLVQVAAEALADVLVDYDVPAGRILAEFRQTLAVYRET